MVQHLTMSYNKDCPECLAYYKDPNGSPETRRKIRSYYREMKTMTKTTETIYDSTELRVISLTFGNNERCFGFSVFRENKSALPKVSRLTPSSPAERAGLKLGDELLSVNDTELRKLSQSEILLMILRCKDSITLEVRREGGFGTSSIIQPSSETNNHEGVNAIIQTQEEDKARKVLISSSIIQPTSGDVSSSIITSHVENKVEIQSHTETRIHQSVTTSVETHSQNKVQNIIEETIPDDNVVDVPELQTEAPSPAIIINHNSEVNVQGFSAIITQSSVEGNNTTGITQDDHDWTECMRVPPQPVDEYSDFESDPPDGWSFSGIYSNSTQSSLDHSLADRSSLGQLSLDESLDDQVSMTQTITTNQSTIVTETTETKEIIIQRSTSRQSSVDQTHILKPISIDYTKEEDQTTPSKSDTEDHPPMNPDAKEEEDQTKPVTNESLQLLYEVRAAINHLTDQDAIALTFTLEDPNFRGMLSSQDQIGIEMNHEDAPMTNLDEDNNATEKEDEERVIEKPKKEKLNFLNRGKSVNIDKSRDLTGAMIKNDGERVLISRIVEGSPAERSGLLKQGDEILAINDIDIPGKKVSEVAQIFAELNGRITFVLKPASGGGEKTMSIECLV